jgi:hypothetical protein
MNLPKTHARILFVTLLLLLTSGGEVLAQTSAATQPSNQTDRRDDEINLETQLYLLLGTNQDVDDAKMPASLDSVIRQLHAWLPFKNYRLSTTLINRVRNERGFNLRWLMTAAGSSGGTLTPSFNEFRVNGVKLLRDASGQQLVRMDGFTFGARIPIQTGMSSSSTSMSTAIINYESTGLNTDISMREGEAVIVGTLNVGPSGEAMILVMSVKRTLK